MSYFCFAFEPICYFLIEYYLIESYCALVFAVYGFQNNLAPTTGSVLTTSGANINFESKIAHLRECLSVCVTGYGVQKNVSNSGGVIGGTGVSTTTRAQTDESYKKDYKFLISDKENFAAKRDTETLMLAKDSGKQFTSSSAISYFIGSLSGDSIKKEKLISSYSETAPLKTESGNSYCECS
uniref:Uncharacterized protein n=1 Tax=Echeneis naucrates TaxID=173247 RepID=A0A665XB88_ECHNA